MEREKASINWFQALVAMPIIIGLLYYGRGFLIPLVTATLLFILTTALVDKIGSLSIGGWSPPLWLARISSLGVMVLCLATVGILISDQVDELSEAGPRYAERVSHLVEQAQELLGPKTVSAIGRAVAEIDLGGAVSTLANQASSLLGTVSLITLYLVFLLAEREQFAQKIPRLADTEEAAERLSGVLEAISQGVKQYMWVNAVTSAMSATVAYVILRLVGVDFAATLALIVFMVGFIPTIGAFIGVFLPSMIALLQFDTMTPFLIVLIGYGGADQFIANVIQPKLQGRSLNLSSFMVLVGLTFWGTLWGGVGAFLAIPMLVVVMIACSQVPALRPLAVLMSSDGSLSVDEGEA